MIKKTIFDSQIFVIYFLFINISFADLRTNLINKITATKTLSFDFKQKIAEKEEVGSCVIKYPLLMKCDYENFKQKSIISNGKSVVIIKKKIQENLSLSNKNYTAFYYSTKGKNFKFGKKQ